MDTVIHVVSATMVQGTTLLDEPDYLAMCGTNLGPYGDARRVHPVGNYLSLTSPLFERVTCEGCRTKFTERRSH